MPTLRPIISTTNSTRSVGGRGKQIDDFLIYVIIVVAATVFLLLIPLATFIFRVYRRKRKRKLQVRRRQILKSQSIDGADGARQNNMNGYGGAFHITPTNSIKPLPRSPIVKDPPNEQMTKMAEKEELNLAEFQKEHGMINKGFHASNNMIQIEMRRSTTDLYLPTSNSLVTAAKRRYSGDLDLKSKSLIIENLATCKSLQNLPKKRFQNDSVEGDTRESTAIKNENSGATSEENDSSDSDDYDDVYENLNHEETTSDSGSSHIYDNIENVTPRSSVDAMSDSDCEHIYSNIDDLSDSDSHIYTNLEELSEEAATDGLDEDDDIYENIRFKPMKRSLSTETTTDDDSDSIIYENTDFLNDGIEVSDTAQRIETRVPEIKPRQKALNTAPIPPRRRYEQSELNKKPKEQAQNQRGYNPQVVGNKPNRTGNDGEVRGQNIQVARKKFQAKGAMPQENGSKPQTRGNNLHVRDKKSRAIVTKRSEDKGSKLLESGIKPQQNGQRPLQNGQRPLKNGQRPLQNGRRALQKGQRPEELRQGAQEGKIISRYAKRQPQVAQNKDKSRNDIQTNINGVRKRIDSEKFV